MPTFFPMSPGMVFEFYELDLIRESDLDFYFDSAGQLQTHEGIHRLGRRAVDVDQTLVRAQLKLFTALLVHVRRTEDRVNALVRWQRHGTTDHGASRLHRLDNLFSRLVDQVVVVRLELDANFLCHDFRD